MHLISILPVAALLLPTISSAHPLQRQANSTSCVPNAYVINSYNYYAADHSSLNIAHGIWDAEVSFDITTYRDGQIYHTDHCSAGEGGLWPSRFDPDKLYDCGAPDMSITGMSGRGDSFVFIHQWNCDRRGYISETPMTITPLECEETDDGSRVGQNCTGPLFSIFAPQNVRVIYTENGDVRRAV
ncbi:hypothetical protein K432DRAFT_427141 [Lepidopterella palustris CBS 459.81]|uniref:AA1-like domain-containing protein n=1 Tax=Lepidopterella palustris CBS 459.81 TaxID=1314670 RepID=A0A8E2E761_9PEZI|nr:hypothetical protein K432DRAFT_427141 [Lepidopterella palustris CBS 459.81]